MPPPPQPAKAVHPGHRQSTKSTHGGSTSPTKSAHSGSTSPTKSAHGGSTLPTKSAHSGPSTPTKSAHGGSSTPTKPAQGVSSKPAHHGHIGSKFSSKTATMGLNGCGNFLKYSMFLFNAIILVAGCGLLGFGVYTHTSSEGLSKISAILGASLFSTFSMALMICGGVVVVVSFLGCCGAIKEVRCMLGTFFILLCIMFLGLVVGAILIFAYRDQIGQHSLTELYRSLNSSYGVTGREQVTQAWDLMQKVFGCCGVEGGINSTSSWAYYKNSTYWYHNQTAGSRRYIPESCCRNQTAQLARCVGQESIHIAPVYGPPVPPDRLNDLMFTEGCYSAFFSFLASNMKILVGIGVGVAAMMVLGMTFSLCLCRRIKDDYYFD